PRSAMQQLLDDVRSGKYAQAWIAENEAGRPTFNKLREVDRHHQLEQVGARLRQMMPFLKPVAAEETVTARGGDWGLGPQPPIPGGASPVRASPRLTAKPFG